jgi:hypothetical protein
VLSLEEVKACTPDELLPRMKYHLLEAGEKVQRTSSSLVEQLRRYLDDQVWLENKRIMAIIHEIEKQAVAIKQQPPKEKDFMCLAETKAQIDLPMSRSLFRPPSRPILSSAALSSGIAEFDTDLLYSQHYVDVALLQARIRKSLQTQPQITLEEICQQHPLEKGLSELVAYINLATHENGGVIEIDKQVEIEWLNEEDIKKSAMLPRIIFTR